MPTKGNQCIITEVHFHTSWRDVKWSVYTTEEKNQTVSQVRLELTPSCAAPNHLRGLYYKSLAAHLTPQRGRGAGEEIGTSATLSFHMVEHHTEYWCTHSQVAWVCSRASATVPHQITDRA